MKIIAFTYDLIGAPIFYHWMKEGNTVIVAQIKDVESLKNGDKPEDPEQKKARLENYDGVFDKYDAKKVLKRMQSIKQKDDWFIFFDFNNLWRFADAVQKMGFKNGFFPTEEDHLFEKDRQAAKEVVEKYYPGLKLVETTEYKTIEEAKAYIEVNPDKMFVAKGNSDDADTFCTDSEIPALGGMELINALEKGKKDYESMGFILEEKINNPIELTPQIVFYDGKPVFTDMDIENKPIGSGSISIQTGCASCLVKKTEFKDEINKIAFPKYVFDMAKKRKGMFVWDASILIDPKTGEKYFGEFCSNRLGWDSVFAEIAMSGGATMWIQNIMNGQNPLQKEFGATVRGFVMAKKGKGLSYEMPMSEMEWMEKEDKKLFVYEMKFEEKDELKAFNMGVSTDLMVSASAADNLPQAVNSCYKGIKGFSFKGLYYRPKFDFLSEEYPTSISNRLKYYDETFAKNNNPNDQA